MVKTQLRLVVPLPSFEHFMASFSGLYEYRQWKTAVDLFLCNKLNYACNLIAYVVTYDLLEDRIIDDVIIKIVFPLFFEMAESFKNLENILPDWANEDLEKNLIICLTCVKCICTADERINGRKGSCSYILNQTVAKNLKKNLGLNGI